MLSVWNNTNTLNVTFNNLSFNKLTFAGFYFVLPVVSITKTIKAKKLWMQFSDFRQSTKSWWVCFPIWTLLTRVLTRHPTAVSCFLSDHRKISCCVWMFHWTHTQTHTPTLKDTLLSTLLRIRRNRLIDYWLIDWWINWLMDWLMPWWEVYW